MKIEPTQRGQGLPGSTCSALLRMANQVGEMLCVSPSGERLGIWGVSPRGPIGLGTADGSEFWVLDWTLVESSEIEVRGLAERDDYESLSESLHCAERELETDRRYFAGALLLLRDAGIAHDSQALIAAAERAESEPNDQGCATTGAEKDA
jgi:hypothetical protein